jgi:hypothetical protein
MNYDLAGKRFGRWAVLRRAKPYLTKALRKQRWHCRCDCGRACIVATRTLTEGKSRGCWGCPLRPKQPNFMAMAGQRIGRLTVLKQVETPRYPTRWHCRCDCGKETEVFAQSLRKGSTQSCGCLLLERLRSYRGKNHPQWKGGKHTTDDGYVITRLPSTVIGAKTRYRAEHRLVVEAYLGRELTADETVHHKNGIRNDNRLENLELWSSRHPQGQRVEDLLKWAKEIVLKYGTLPMP